MNDIITLIVISDLHCGTQNSAIKSSTRLYSDSPRIPDYRHPIAALLRLVRESDLTADVILCPGDITDKAGDQGFVSGWTFLKEIKSAFKAKYLLATLGNHDVKSRAENGFPFDFAKTMSEDYPIGDEGGNAEFWANNFSIIEDDETCFLVFNSSFSHTNKDNAEKCIINDAILYQIEERLKRVGNKKYKIGMCHHHAEKHANKDYYDGDVMDKGDRLIGLLNKYDFQILIHGHKHDPKLNIINSLPVLASGSFSSLENLPDTGAENVFHIIRLHSNQKKAKIISYVYKPKEGWINKLGSYFPYSTGFAPAINVETLVNNCAAWFLEQNKEYIPYSRVVEQFPDFEYLTPDEQQKASDLIKSVHKIEFQPDLSNSPKNLYMQI